MRKSIMLIIWLGLFFIQLCGYQVVIGNGSNSSQHLPCDPFYNHSGSQLIYDSNYFPYSGTITEISFQYQFLSDNPADFLNNVTLMIGESQLDSFEDDESYIDLDELEICFEGNLTENNFQAINNNGAGWFKVTLDQAYYYSKTGNLILFFLENNPENGSNGDNFISFLTSQNTSLCFVDLDNTIDINNLAEPVFVRNWLPNSLFELTIDENYPQIVYPSNNDENISPSTSLQVKVENLNNTLVRVYSATNVFDIDIDNNFQYISDNIYEIYPPLPFAPSSHYEWKIIYTEDDIEYASEMFSFDTVDYTPGIELTNTDSNNYSIEFSWNCLYENQYPYFIYRNGQVLSTQCENFLIDTQVLVGEIYEYQVRFFYIDNSNIESNVCFAELNESDNTIIDDEFESYSSFQSDIGEWQNIDQDENTVYSLPGYEYQNQGDESGFLVFEPGAITPPLNLNITGEKCLVSFASIIPPSSDVIISPAFHASHVDVDVYLKSYDTTWGMERVKCGLMFNNDEDNIFYFNEGNYFEITTEMTHLNFLHQSTNVEDVITNFWLESCGVQTLMLIIDRIVVSTDATDNQDSTQLIEGPVIFPNPVRDGSFELTNLRADSRIRVYNLKGQLVYKSETNSKTQRVILPKSLTSGIYIVKVKSSQGEFVKKMSVLK